MDIFVICVYLLSLLYIRVKAAHHKQKENIMAKSRSNKEVTSKKAATAASKVLRDPKSSAAAKTAAASALTQRPNKK